MQPQMHATPNVANGAPTPHLYSQSVIELPTQMNVCSAELRCKSTHRLASSDAPGDGQTSMKRNFQFNYETVVRFGDKWIDLHNDYDLERFGTDLSGNTVTLSFTRNENAIRPDALPLKVALHCTGNVRVAFKDLNQIESPLKELGIEIAYFDEDCDWDSYTTEDIAATQEPEGLYVYFMDDLIVRIYCEVVTLETT
jgi:hypothetical protein